MDALLHHFISRVFLVELGILGLCFGCFHHRDQGLNEDPGKKGPDCEVVLFQCQELLGVGLGRWAY